MTPEQMIALADRLRTLAGVGRWFDRSAATAGATASFESDVHAAADLIRQRAERDAMKARRLGSMKITETLGAEFTFTCPLTVKPGDVFDLSAAPPAPPDTKTEPITGTQVEVIHGPQSLSELDLTVYRRQISEMQTQPDDTALLRRALDALTELMPPKDDLNHGGHDARDVRNWQNTVASLRARLDGAPQPDDTAIQPDWNQLETTQESLREHMQMIRDDTALLRQALNALEMGGPDDGDPDHADLYTYEGAITALRARLDGAPQPAPSLSKRLADAGFTRRDTRIECDECGKKVTPQFLPIHECAPQPDDTALLRQALNRIEDMLLNDDGQAFKEARKFSDTLRARLDGAPQPNGIRSEE